MCRAEPVRLQLSGSLSCSAVKGRDKKLMGRKKEKKKSGQRRNEGQEEKKSCCNKEKKGTLGRPKRKEEDQAVKGAGPVKDRKIKEEKK
jgi:hypothetical protein